MGPSALFVSVLRDRREVARFLHGLVHRSPSSTSILIDNHSSLFLVGGTSAGKTNLNHAQSKVKKKKKDLVPGFSIDGTYPAQICHGHVFLNPLLAERPWGIIAGKLRAAGTRASVARSPAATGAMTLVLRSIRVKA